MVKTLVKAYDLSYFFQSVQNLSRSAAGVVQSSVHLRVLSLVPCSSTSVGVSYEVGLSTLFGMHTPSGARLRAVNDSKSALAALNLSIGGKNFHFVPTLGTLFNSERWSS